MPTLKLKFVLNEGRIGIPLGKLADIAKDTREFLAMVADDLDLPGDEWIAANFGNGSVFFDCERVAIDTDSFERGKRGLRAILSNLPVDDLSGLVRSATRLKYSAIAKRLAVDERIRIGLYENGNAEPGSWYELSRDQAQRIEEAHDRKAEYYGEIQGYVHAFYKEARKPRLVVRDLATRALVDCFFGREMYEAAVETMSEPEAVIFVEGTVSEDVGRGIVEAIEVADFHLAPQFDLTFFESFIGTKPDLTGEQVSEHFVRTLREEDDAGAE